MSKNSPTDKDEKKKAERKLEWGKEGTASWLCKTLPPDLEVAYKPPEKTKPPSIAGEVPEASE